MSELEFEPVWFSPPSDTIAAAMMRRSLSVDEFCELLAGGMDEAVELLEGTREIDKTIASRLSRVLGGSPDFWIARQSGYEKALDRVVRKLNDVELRSWVDTVPSPVGSRKSNARKRLLQHVRSAASFFNTPSLEIWRLRYGAEVAAARFHSSKSFAPDEAATALWMRHGEVAAKSLELAEFSRERLIEVLPEVRELLKSNVPHRFFARLRAILASTGVALVVATAPKGCRASGLAKPLPRNRRLILLSLRHGTDDHFWFTLFHEIGHLVLHDGTFIDADDLETTREEKEASEFARLRLLPEAPDDKAFKSAQSYRNVIRIARKLEVPPGVLVGQMQHRGVIPHNWYNKAKRRWTVGDFVGAVATP